MRKRIYLGLCGRDNASEVFKFDREPTFGTHGHIYAAVVGPFRTLKAAKWAEKRGFLNPHFQTVSDAERLCRL
jgi:hypothetical protein